MACFWLEAACGCFPDLITKTWKIRTKNKEKRKLSHNLLDEL